MRTQHRPKMATAGCGSTEENFPEEETSGLHGGGEERRFRNRQRGGGVPGRRAGRGRGVEDRTQNVGKDSVTTVSIAAPNAY